MREVDGNMIDMVTRSTVANVLRKAISHQTISDDKVEFERGQLVWHFRKNRMEDMDAVR